MTDQPFSSANYPFDWNYETSEVAPSGLVFDRLATDAERQALTAALGILDCQAVRARYRIRRAPAECYRLTGTVTAEVVQACVVTLAPVHESIEAELNVEFQPEADSPESAGPTGGAVDISDDLDIEPIDSGRLPVGRIVFEVIAASLNPYPRRPGAEYRPAADSPATAKTPNPFAVLAKLKPPGEVSE
jgi:uncharacterized metal-binding protein YceD (DUF177 family)